MSNTTTPPSGPLPDSGFLPFRARTEHKPTRRRPRLGAVFAVLLSLLAVAFWVSPVARSQNRPFLATSAAAASTLQSSTTIQLVNADFSEQDGWANCVGANENNWDIQEGHLRVLGAGPACVFQTVDALAGQRYELSCVSYEEAPGTTQLRVSALGSAWQTLDETSSVVTAGSRVTEASLTAPDGSAHIGITFDSTGAGYSSYDRCTLTASSRNEPPQPPPPAVNLLQNGGFDGVDGWTSCGSSNSYSIDSSQLNITATEPSPACLYQEIPGDWAGTNLELGCSSSVATGYASITLSAADSNYATLESVSKEDAAASEPMSLIAPAGTAFAVATIYSEGSSTFDACVLSTESTPPIGGTTVTVTADEFYADLNGQPGYPWQSLAAGTTVKLEGNFQSGIRLTSAHSGLIFDGGHTIDGTDGWANGAVLNGTGYQTPDYHNGAIQIDGASNLTVQNFKIGNYSSTTIKSNPKAIYVLGNSSNIIVQKNEIFEFSTVHETGCATNGPALALCGSAHGILVSTEREAPSTIQAIGIYSNLIYNMDLGKSEALTIKGDVRRFFVKFNTIHDTNNIAIDVAGYVQESDNTFYSTQGGEVEGNTIYNVDTRGSQGGFLSSVVRNQAYADTQNGGLPNQSAACIYVDGGRDVEVVANRVSRCNIGISINGELDRNLTAGSESAQDVVVEGNLVYDSSATGFKLGSGGATAAGVDGCDIRNNYFYTNDAVNLTFDAAGDTDIDRYHDGTGEIWIEHSVRNCKVRDNLFLASSIRTNAPGDLRQTVFANTMSALGTETALFTNNQFSYQDQPSGLVARCQWIGFENRSMTDCLTDLNSNGGSGNTFEPISKPADLELPPATRP